MKSIEKRGWGIGWHMGIMNKFEKGHFQFNFFKFMKVLRKLIIIETRYIYH